MTEERPATTERYIVDDKGLPCCIVGVVASMYEPVEFDRAEVAALEANGDWTKVVFKSGYQVTVNAPYAELRQVVWPLTMVYEL